MKKREKIACDNCGVMVSRGSIARHKKSKKCLDLK
jgi:microcompartment protein CcmK/EutM